MIDTTKTDFGLILQDLDGGVFESKLGALLSAAALAVVLPDTSSNKAKITIELELSQVGNSSQVIMAHKIKAVQPTRRGKTTEEDTTETPLFVARGGKLHLTPPKTNALGQLEVTDGLFSINTKGNENVK